jgi:hypothetical protein
MAAPVTPDPELAARVRALVLRVGTRGAAHQLDAAEATVARIVAQLPITVGTALRINARLTELASEVA